MQPLQAKRVDRSRPPGRQAWPEQRLRPGASWWTEDAAYSLGNDHLVYIMLYIIYHITYIYMIMLLHIYTYIHIMLVISYIMLYTNVFNSPFPACASCPGATHSDTLLCDFPGPHLCQTFVRFGLMTRYPPSILRSHLADVSSGSCIRFLPHNAFRCICPRPQHFRMGVRSLLAWALSKAMELVA